MSDNTTNNHITNNHIDTAATRKVANTQAKEDSRRTEDGRRSAAALLGRALQSRFAAVARQAVALGLIRAGADEFTHCVTGDYPDGFPFGSDYGALCEQDDLDKAQAEAIFQEARQAVQAEAAHMAHGASPDLAEAITRQLAEWEDGAALEWANMRRIREKIDREDAEMEAAKNAEKKEAEKKDTEEKKPAPAPRLYLRQPMTPGMEYVEDWLGGMADTTGLDPEWIAQNIDQGFFLVCPRCHFLHLPRVSWDLARRKSAAPRRDACDVCAHVESAATFPFAFASLRKTLDSAPEELAEARRGRAQSLFDLWMGGSCAADLWLWAEMKGAVQRVEETARLGEKPAEG